MGDDPGLTVVFVSQGPLAAEVAKSKLESQGISALLRYQAIGRVLGLTVDGLGRVEVLVPSPDARSARDLLAEGADVLNPEDPFPTTSGEAEPPARTGFGSEDL